MYNTIRVAQYCPEHRLLWDSFLKHSKNGVFLFYRDYMEYHANRFVDNSLMFFEGDKLLAVMPANIKDNLLFSHSGLTFGGIISNYEMKTQSMLKIFESLVQYCGTFGIKEIVYKAIPHIYHRVPAEEDLYALFRYNARLTKREVASTIFEGQRIPFSNNRKRCIQKSKREEFRLERSYDFKAFMNIVEEGLSKKYDAKPTHSADEIQLLAERFPENVKLFVVHKGNKMLAGALVYESVNVAHAQYCAGTDEGKELHATDFILNFLINDYYLKKRYFDFGISTERAGRYLNEYLITYKERFGARAIVYDTYELEI